MISLFFHSSLSSDSMTWISRLFAICMSDPNARNCISNVSCFALCLEEKEIKEEEKNYSPFAPCLLHFSICTPAEEQKSSNDQKTTRDCRG